MTPREFLKRYSFDERLVNGRFFPSTPLELQDDDRVAVVLFNLGGPRNQDEVESFLYNLFMDPAIIDIPLPTFLRHPICTWVARKRSQTVREEYGLIGGCSPLNAYTKSQAKLLEAALNGRETEAGNVSFRVYTAMRYGWPSSEDAAAQMRADGITKVVLLPLYPHFSKTTTGASLVYWKALEDDGTLPRLPTVSVFEYAAHPAYIDAINARIEEGLSRFPEDIRRDVYLLFSAHGTPVKEMTVRKDPYCCLIHSTVSILMQKRGESLQFEVAFQSKVGPAEWLTPSTLDALKRLADEGRTNVLVIPIAFVSDHIETVFELDIEIRKEAEEAGIERFEVMTGLNDHPLFIESLADVTLRHVGLPGLTAEGQGIPARRHAASSRSLTCHQCIRNAEAWCWSDSNQSNYPVSDT